jgi:preprotein translocase subunit SecY
MASAAEQMAANMSWRAFGKATELRQRIWFTLGLLIIYRIGTYIPGPRYRRRAELRAFFDQAAAGLGGVLNMFTGGALSPAWGSSRWASCPTSRPRSSCSSWRR